MNSQNELINNAEVECLKLKKSINENHHLFQKAIGEAIERGVLAGEMLLRWKELLPHGRFESFTETHFDGSLRTARTYMQAAKYLNSLPKRQRTAVLKEERSISGLIEHPKKQAPVRPGPPEPPPEPDPTPDPPELLPPEPPIGQWVGEEDDEPVEDSPRSGNGAPKSPPKQLDRAAWFKQWEQAIGPVVRLVSAIGRGVGEPKCTSRTMVLEHLEIATQEMMEWMEVEK